MGQRNYLKMNVKTRPHLLSDMLVGGFGQLVNEILNEDEVSNKSKNFRPAIEIKEQDDSYTISAALPGVKKDNISIEIEQDYLKISGNKLSDDTKDKTHLSEFIYGSFERKVLLAKNAELNSVTAEFEDGLLHICIAKKEEAKPKNIFIK